MLGGVIQTSHLPPPAGASSRSIPADGELILTPPFQKLKLKRKPTGRVRRQQQCGVTPDTSETRIMGGEEARWVSTVLLCHNTKACHRFGQFPWVAYLSIKGPDIDKMCAGTLISPTFVLTAGHCVDFCSMNINPGCKRTDPFPRITIKV